MECLKSNVHPKYHRLFKLDTIKIQEMLCKMQADLSEEDGKSTSSKILNGPPEISRDTNGSFLHTVKSIEVFFILSLKRAPLHPFDSTK